MDIFYYKLIEVFGSRSPAIFSIVMLELSEDAAGRSTEAIRRQLEDATEERNNVLAKITAEQKIIDFYN